jgi:serine/threonine protein phosphatase 1
MLFAIGDIHGHFDKLMRLMGHCRDFAQARSETHVRFVLLGDYVDRGPASRQVLDYLDSEPAEVTAILGNHEAMMAAAQGGGKLLTHWLSNGGEATLASYGIDDPRHIPSAHLRLIDRLPLSVDDGLRLFVHAGIDPRAPYARDPGILLWTRNHPASDQPLPRFLVHGHTPVTRTCRNCTPTASISTPAPASDAIFPQRPLASSLPRRWHFWTRTDG